MRKFYAAVIALTLGGILYVSNLTPVPNQDPYPCPPEGCPK
jgi:hypothetical protein